MGSLDSRYERGHKSCSRQFITATENYSRDCDVSIRPTTVGVTNSKCESRGGSLSNSPTNADAARCWAAAFTVNVKEFVNTSERSSRSAALVSRTVQAEVCFPLPLLLPDGNGGGTPAVGSPQMGTATAFHQERHPGDRLVPLFLRRESNGILLQLLSRQYLSEYLGTRAFFGIPFAKAGDG